MEVVKKNHSQNQDSKFNHQLLSYLPTKLNIYDQAYLLKMQSTLEMGSFNIKWPNDINLLFSLGGELQGYVLSTLSLGKVQLNSSKTKDLKDIFSESINIMLGQFLTKLDGQLGLMINLSPPRYLNSTPRIPVILKETKPYMHQFKIDYIFIHQGIEYNCHFYFRANAFMVKTV
jgi:hypothetical protein